MLRSSSVFQILGVTIYYYNPFMHTTTTIYIHIKLAIQFDDGPILNPAIWGSMRRHVCCDFVEKLWPRHYRAAISHSREYDYKTPCSGVYSLIHYCYHSQCRWQCLCIKTTQLTLWPPRCTSITPNLDYAFLLLRIIYLTYMGLMFNEILSQ